MITTAPRRRTIDEMRVELAAQRRTIERRRRISSFSERATLGLAVGSAAGAVAEVIYGDPFGALLWAVLGGAWYIEHRMFARNVRRWDDLAVRVAHLEDAVG